LYESYLSYGITLWGDAPASHTSPLLVSQKNCCRILFGDREAYLDKFKTCARTRPGPKGEQILGKQFFRREHDKTTDEQKFNPPATQPVPVSQLYHVLENFKVPNTNFNVQQIWTVRPQNNSSKNSARTHQPGLHTRSNLECGANPLPSLWLWREGWMLKEPNKKVPALPPTGKWPSGMGWNKFWKNLVQPVSCKQPHSSRETDHRPHRIWYLITGDGPILPTLGRYLSLLANLLILYSGKQNSTNLINTKVVPTWQLNLPEVYRPLETVKINKNCSFWLFLGLLIATSFLAPHWYFSEELKLDNYTIPAIETAASWYV